MKRWRIMLFVVTVVGLSLLLALAALAGPLPDEARVADVVDSQISYQGRLTDAAGNPLSGAHMLCFGLFDAQTAGRQLSSECINVTVDNGLFSVLLNVAQASFDGQELWLRITVDGEELSERQEVLPVPYALSLRPGATISGSVNGAIVHIENSNASGRGLRAYATSPTGTNYGVVGASRSTAGYGGYFYNSAVTGTTYGVGGFVESPLGYGGSFWSNAAGGVGLRARGGSNLAPDLELGGSSTSDDDGRIYSDQKYTSSDIVMVSNDEFHIYLDNDNNESATFRVFNGAQAQVFQVDESGNLIASGSKTGFVADIARSADEQPLQPGDVVAIVGVSDPVIGQIPVMTVRRTTAANSSAVAGVVDQGFVPAAEVGAAAQEEGGASFVALAAGEGIANGQYLSVVTHGAYRWVNVDASYGAIGPGDLLVSSPTPGHAMVASEPRPGTVIGKALGTLASGRGRIPVLVTLQ